LYRQGFALVAVLWILVGLSTLALAMAVAGRQALATAQSRLDAARARWAAEGCLERTRAAIADVLAGRATWIPDTSAPGALDRAVAPAPILTSVDCTVAIQPTGIALDVNTAGASDLRRLFVAVGLADSAADSLADAILDWRHSDDVPRALGAQRDWYAAHRQALPRNAPFVDVHELRLVRGFAQALDRAPALDTLLTVEPDRILLDRAPAQVLATLPGLTRETIAEILAERAAGIHLGDLAALAAVLPVAARDSLDANMATIGRLTTTVPAAWVVRATATSGSAPGTSSSVEVRLVFAGARAAILRRRVWP